MTDWEQVSGNVIACRSDNGAVLVSIQTFEGYYHLRVGGKIVNQVSCAVGIEEVKAEALEKACAFTEVALADLKRTLRA